MVNFLQRPKTVFFLICILSGFGTSLTIVIDTWGIAKYNFDPIIYGVYSMLIGIFTAFIFVVLLSFIKITTNVGRRRPLGAIFDPDFRGIILPTKEWRVPYKYLTIAGIFGGLNVLFYFISAEIVDPSIFQPLLQFVTLYFLVIEVILIDKEWPTIIEVLAIMNVTFGGILLTLSGELSNDLLWGVLFVLGPMNISQIIITYLQKKARGLKSQKGRYLDALNMRLYFVTIMAISMIIFGIPLYTPERIANFIPSFNVMFPIALISMVIIFFSYILYIRALYLGKMSTVNAVTSVSIVFSVIFTLIISIIDPDTLGTVSLNAVDWLFKSIGTIMVVFAIIALSISDVKTYIFIKVNIGKSNLVWNQLKNIKGINSVHFLSGTYDFLCYLNIKSLGRVNSLLCKKIENLEGIQSTYTVTVLKQWERF